MKKYIRIFALIVLYGLSSLAFAQSWKPLCVDGRGDQGVHNGTWHQINTPATGGANWKQLGNCPIPPPPPPPTKYYYYVCEFGVWYTEGIDWFDRGAYITNVLTGAYPVQALLPDGSWVTRSFGDASNVRCNLIDTSGAYVTLFNLYQNNPWDLTLRY